MAGRIFIEASDVTSGGLPSPVKHLYLVYEAESGIEYTIRAGPDGAFKIFGSFEILDNVRLSNSPDARELTDRPDRNSTDLSFAGMTDDQAWALMLKYARSFEATEPDYNAFTSNSNTFIGALLAGTGEDPYDLLPSGVPATQAIGFGNFGDILDELAPPSDWRTLGTAAAETFFGEAHGEEISASGGADVVYGRGGSDLILGEGGADLLHGQNGSDVLRGGAGRDSIWGGADSDKLVGGQNADMLFGGRGSDVLIGGRGADELTGGRGADTFVLSQSPGVDTITDFEGASDKFVLADGLQEEDIALSDTGDFVLIELSATGDVLAKVHHDASAEIEFWDIG
ncbi:calcium-binding protein [Tropicimonas marinistellae]|uniref:calcium-binding protein n=1 Tax=Tropicimonas marinistellae TaxID=1739787 RepID=UPI0008321769|nr:calcium-binding protein [Tropicimonas marinistellae]